MKILDLEQRSQEWLRFRKSKITATDMAKVMNLSPWENSVSLWKKKVGIIEDDFYMSAAMQRGIDNEDDARVRVNAELNKEFSECVILSDENNWLMASLDGKEGDCFCEIKIPMVQNYSKLVEEPIPIYYQIQMQTAFAASDGVLQKGYFCVYSPESDIVNIREILPNIEMIEKILEEGYIFWRRLLEFDCPPSIHRVVTTKYMQETVDNYRMACDMAKRADEYKEKAKKLLLEIAGDDCIEGFGLKLTKFWRKGSIDYKKIPELKNIDLEKYRKEASESIRISL